MGVEAHGHEGVQDRRKDGGARRSNTAAGRRRHRPSCARSSSGSHGSRCLDLRGSAAAATAPAAVAPADAAGERFLRKIKMSSHRLETSGTSESTNNSSSQTPNRRAPVWEYYEPDLVEKDGVLKVNCKYCGTKLTANRKSGTNSLRTHIAEHCPTVPSDDRNKFVATMKKKPVDGSFTFNQHRSHDLMIAWCVRADVAFNKFDDEGFEPWMESLQPAFRCIGRQMIRNECVAKFEREKIELRSKLQSLNSRICFTSDLWTSNQKLGYICVTAHYIGPDFVLKKKIIAFKDMKYPHAGVAIEEAITTILADYGIKEKIFTITLNNAANL